MTNADIIPRESLMDRARLRLANNPDCVTPRRTGDQPLNVWEIKGDLGDQRAKYYVTWSNQVNKYRCVCEAYRDKKICSHMLAVVLWRKVNQSLNVVDEVSLGTSTTATEGVQMQLSPVSEDGPPSSEREVGSVAFTAPPSDALTLMDFNLPDWVQEVRPHQWDAVNECVELFKSGVKVVWLDAPTGSGKTLIAEMVRQVLNKPAMYVCSGKELQDQFARDFDYSAVLKGRSNYATQVGGSEISAADCTSSGWDDPCAFCPDKAACEYTVAKNAALRSNIAVLNTTYLLTEANGPGRFSGRGLGILDECDVVESELMNYVEFYVGDKALRELKVVAPKKGSHYKTIMAWVREELLPAAELRLADLKAQGRLFIAGGEDVKHERKVKTAARLVSDIYSVLANHGSGVGDDADDNPGDNWVRDNNDALRLKAVSVAEYSKRMLWNHCDQWLCMSATIISPELMAESLGLEDDEWGVVRVPMTFPVENRPIYQVPVVSMTYKDKDTAWPEMVEGIVKVVGQSKHDGERVLIHGVSYALCKEIVSGLQRAGLRDGSTGQQRRILTYKTAWERANCLVDFRASNGAVLVAPSMDRGVDFKNDDCRVVILPKVPAPSLGDPQVSKKMHGASGQLWYDVQIIRSIVQMTGRGVRSADDWCVTYILDSQFGTNVFKKRKRLFPSWWRDAVVFMRLRDLE